MAPMVLPLAASLGKEGFWLAAAPVCPAGKKESPPSAGKVGGEGRCWDVTPILMPLQRFSPRINLPVASCEWPKGHRQDCNQLAGGERADFLGLAQP